MHNKSSFPLKISSVNVGKLRIQPHLLKKFVMENFIFCAVWNSCSEMFKKMDVPKSMKICVVETTLIQIYSFQPGTLLKTDLSTCIFLRIFQNYSQLLPGPCGNCDQQYLTSINSNVLPQPTFACSKLSIETVKQGVKYVQS